MAKVSLRSYNREIETMIDRGQLDEAVAHCHHILKTFPKHLETYRLLGKAYLESKRYDDATDIFSRVLVSVPNDFVAQVGMSIIRDEENKLNDAIWHMERAFEKQPSNAAIQSELQRLYGRRDGVQPPRIRMTRGALAHMYVQGELYPQAISEIKSVLKEDPERSDMQALLARACYESGAKNDAIDAALVLLQRYPYSLDANRVLTEVLGADRNENAQAYRQRVVELDPYASQVTGTIFRSNEVSDAAVNIERLDWNGQPVGMQSDWRESQAISLESGMPSHEEPDWLKNSSAPSTPPPLSQPVSASIFETSTPPATTPEQPAEDIPDFLRSAGWGQSTGAFDESKSIFGDETPATPPAQPIEQGDLPDWVKAMAPTESPAQDDEKEDELPDWINKIGTGALSSQPGDETDWMSQLGEPSQPSVSETNDQADWMDQFPQSEPVTAEPAGDQPDWIKGLDSESDFTPQPAQTDVPDWMKELGSEAPSMSPTQSDVPDWMNELGSETPSAISAAEMDVPDWMKELGSETPSATSDSQTDESDWMKGFGDATESAPAPAQADESDWLGQFGTQTEAAATAPASNDFDFLNELTQEPIPETPFGSPPVTSNFDTLGVSEQERDDSFAWLENLAAKQGASEGLLTKPEDRLEEEPDWVKQAKEFGSQQPPVSESPVSSLPSSNVDDLGKSEQERDDSFAWLENLAAKQGASEGLLTKPEDRLEDEPEWVKQAKEFGSQQPPVSEMPAASEPLANVEEFVKSEQERDDSFALFENLVANQDASEGLLTKPEDRLQDELDWVEQAKDFDAQESPVAQPPVPPSANVEELGKSEQERDDSFAWLENLAAKQGASEGLLTKPEDRLEEEPEWVKQAKEFGSQQSPVSEMPAASETPANVEELGMSEQERDDSFAWLENLAAKQGASEGLLTKPEDRLEEEPDWVKQAKDFGSQQPPVSEPSVTSSANVDDLGKSEQERDDSFAWLENLAAKQGASEGLLTKPEERLEDEPEWVRQAKDISAQQQQPVAPVSEQPDDTEAWLKDLAEEESAPDAAAQLLDVDMPAWMNNIERDETPAVESAVPAQEADDQSDWIRSLETPVSFEEEKPRDEELPNWLSELDEEEKQTPISLGGEDLPEWLRGEDVAPAQKPEPTRTTDWKPAEVQPVEPAYVSPAEEEKQPEVEKPLPPVSFDMPEEKPQVVTQQEKPKPEPRPVRKPIPRPTPVSPYVEPVTRRGTGMLVMPGVDPMLGLARNELSRSNIPGALESYGKLIKKARFLDEVIHDLREALYRYPVEVSIWQSLGDAYMRANRLQDALDAYTKAEELLR